MNKTELVTRMAEKTGLTKADVEKVYNATFELFKEELAKGNKISVSGFGTFDISERAEREGRNPQTGETITIAATKTPTFKFSATTKKEIKECLK